ncbi:hypothetical protein [Flavobacterium sp. N1994]
MNAAKNGKKVTVQIELQARFDEALIFPKQSKCNKKELN